jgi:multiple sugar transport system permease protein
MQNALTQNKTLRIVTYFTLTTFCVYCLFPFLWMIDTAFKPIGEIRSTTPTFLILGPTLDNFRRVLFDTAFLIFFRNSLIVAVASTLFTMIVAIFVGYAMSRWGQRQPVKIVSAALVASQMVPGVLLLVPLYMLMMKLHLLSSYAALILVYTTFMLPICAFMLKGYFDAIPPELEEAAQIDGCDLSRRSAVVGSRNSVHLGVRLHQRLERIHVWLCADQR